MAPLKVKWHAAPGLERFRFTRGPYLLLGVQVVLIIVIEVPALSFELRLNADSPSAKACGEGDTASGPMS